MTDDIEQLRAENARLLPCPFCGATPHSMKSKKMYDQDGEPYQDRIIRCPHLCASMQGGEEEIADRWNTRAALSADPAPAPGVTMQEAAKVLAEAMSLRIWQYYPIEMPVTGEGRGPATVGVDAASIEYEVWRATDLSSIGSYKNLPDAITSALRAIAEENGND